MQKAKRIFGVGRVILDHVVMIPEYPACDTKCLVTEHWRQVGGPVPVALATAGHFGIQTCFLGTWGQDPAGSEVSAELTRRGIDTSLCIPRDETGFAQIWTEQGTGKRTVAASPAKELTTDRLHEYKQALDGFGILHLDGSSADVAIPLARHMKDLGGKVVLDAGSKKPGMEELFPLLDLLVASNLFCQSWFGPTASASLGDLLQLGCQAAVRTLGERGATYSDGKQELHQAAMDVQPVDTNGAGDIFCGAFLRGLAEDWDVDRTLEFANAVAGYSCGYKGNTTLPTA